MPDPDMIVAALTTQLHQATAPTDYVLQDWSAAGLNYPTAFRAYLASFLQSELLYEIGELSDRDWQEVQARLKIAIAVP